MCAPSSLAGSCGERDPPGVPRDGTTAAYLIWKIYTCSADGSRPTIAATWQGMVTMTELATHDERPKRINGFEMRVEILADERNELPLDDETT